MAKGTKLTSPVSPSHSENISIRKISNGFLVEKSSYGKNGYSSVTTYTPTKPEIEIDKPPTRAKARPQGNALTHAAGKLR